MTADAACLSRLDGDLIDDRLREQLVASGARLPVRTVALARHEGEALEALASGGGLGLLLADGHVAHHRICDGRAALEVCGPGDVISLPGSGDVADECRLTPLSDPVLVGVLDERFLHRARSAPSLLDALARRQCDRVERLGRMLAVLAHPHVEARVLLAMSHLAERWGRVRADGVLLPIPLTHQLIGDIVGARRPTVTLAITQLAARERLVRVPEGWLLPRSMAMRAAEAA